jgi:hypothetical protein
MKLKIDQTPSPTPLPSLALRVRVSQRERGGELDEGWLEESTLSNEQLS